MHLPRRQHPSTPWINHGGRANMTGLHVVVNNPFAGSAQAASAKRTLILSRQPAVVFGCHHCPSKRAFFWPRKCLFLKTSILSWREGGQLLVQNFAQHFFCAPAAWHNLPAWLRHGKPLMRRKHNSKAISHEWTVSTSISAREVWSLHTTTIWLNMFTCFAYGTISEAACASQWLHTIQRGHAMCLFGWLFSVISYWPVGSLAATLPHCFATYVAIAFAAVQVCPLVATCVAKGFCL